MAFTPEQSRIKLSAEQEKQVAEMPSDQIAEYLHSLAVEQGHVMRDWDPELFVELNPPTPKRFARTITVNGQQHVLEADSEQGLLEQETAFYRSVFSNEPSSEQSSQQQTHSTAVEQPSSEPVLDSYMRSIGIDPDKGRNQSVVTEWANATQQFLERHPDWEGGDENRRSIQNAIIALGLTDRPSLETLEAAFQEIVRTENYFENPELAEKRSNATAIANATSIDEIRSAARKSVGLPELSTRNIDDMSWR